MSSFSNWSRGGEDPPGSSSHRLSITDGRSPASKNTSYVSESMLELVRKQLEENYNEEVRSLRREFTMEREERKENEKRIKRCVEELMVRVVQLDTKVTLVEERMEEMGRRRGREEQQRHHQQEQQQPPPPKPSSPQRRQEPVPVQSTSTSSGRHREAVERDRRTPQVAQVKTEKVHEVVEVDDEDDNDEVVEFEDFTSAIVLRVEGNVEMDSSSEHHHHHQHPQQGREKQKTMKQTRSGRVVKPSQRLSDSRNGGDDYDDDDDDLEQVEVADTAESERNSSEIQAAEREAVNMSPSHVSILHGKSEVPGRFLPFVCICGLEFDSETSLSNHLVEEDVLGEEEEKTKPKATPKERLNRSTEPVAIPSIPSISRLINISVPLVKIERPSISSVSIPRKGNRHGKADPSRPRLCLCGQEFNTNLLLNIHIKHSLNKKSFKCEVCGKKFNFGAHLRLHLKSHRLTGDNENTQQQLNLNTDNHHDNDPTPDHRPNPTQPLHCICGVKYRNELALQKHVKYFNIYKKTRKRERKTSRKRLLYTSHRKPHIRKKPKISSRKRTMPARGASKNLLNPPPPPPVPSQKPEASNEKVAQDTEENPSKKKKLAQAQKRHGKSPLTPLHCICGVEYRSEQALQSHITYFTVVKRNSLPCKVCGWKFAYASQLQRHVQSKHFNRPQKSSSKDKVRTSNNVPVSLAGPSQSQTSVENETKKMVESGSRVVVKKVNSITSSNRNRSRRLLKKTLKAGKRHGEDPSKPLFCICGVEFRDEKALYYHIYYFNKIKNAKACRICGVHFSQGSRLRSHLLNVHQTTSNSNEYKDMPTLSPAPQEDEPSKQDESVAEKGPLRKEDYSDERTGLRLVIKKVSKKGKKPILSSATVSSSSSPSTSKNLPVNMFDKIKSNPRKTAKKKASPSKPGSGSGGSKHGVNPANRLYCLCWRKYSDERALQQHINYYLNVKNNMLPCKTCGKKYPYASQLNEHVLKAHGKKSSSKSNDLDDNQAPVPSSSSMPSSSSTSKKVKMEPSFNKSKHGIGEEAQGDDGLPKFFCKCGRSYPSKGVLNFHIRMASTGKLLTCSLCTSNSKQYTPVSLKFHMKTKHEDPYLSREKQVNCFNCPELFQTETEMVAHWNVVHKPQ